MKRRFTGEVRRKRNMAVSGVGDFEWRKTFASQLGSPILCLPLEVLEKISYSLNPEDRFNLRTSSKQLRVTVDGTWKDVDYVILRILPSPEEQQKEEARADASCPRFGPCQNGPECTTHSMLRFRITRSQSTQSVLSTQCSTTTKERQIRWATASQLADKSRKCLLSVKFGMIDFFNGNRSVISYEISCGKAIPWLKVLGRHAQELSVEIPSCESGFHEVTPRMIFLQRLFQELCQGRDSFFPSLRSLAVTTCVILGNDKWMSSIKEISSSRGLKELTLKTESPCNKDSQRESRELLRQLHAMGITQGSEMQFLEDSLGLEAGEDRTGSIVKAVQGILEASQGSLELLNVDGLLGVMSVPLRGIRYPALLKTLVTERLGEQMDDVAVLTSTCPNLEVLSVLFRNVSPKDIQALTSMKKLRTLTLSSVLAPDTLAEEIRRETEKTETLWPLLESITLRFSSVSDFLLRSLAELTSLKSVQILSMKESSFVTEGAMMGMCRLPHLQHLHLDLPFSVEEAFGHTCLDCLSEHCAELESLKVKRCSLNVLTLPRLLRQCRKLKTVELKLELSLDTLDTVVMARSIAADLDSRTGRTDVEVTAINGGTYESVNRILEGIPKNSDMILSDLTDYCLHGEEECIPCRFSDKRRSLVLGRKDLRTAFVVFHSPFKTPAPLPN